MVRWGLGAADAVQAQVCHEALDGAAGHVTGIVTLGDFGSVEHYCAAGDRGGAGAHGVGG